MSPAPDGLPLSESEGHAARADDEGYAGHAGHAARAGHAPATGPFDHDAEHALLDAVIWRLPEFLPTYLAMVEACDDDPGEPAVFVELADFVSDRLAVLATGRPELERALGLIEAHLERSDNDHDDNDHGGGGHDTGDTDDTADLVGLAFFDSFSPEDRRRLVPWLGPRSLAALEALDVTSDG